MNKRNITDINKFLIDNEDLEDYNNNQYLIKTEGNQKINQSPPQNKNNSKSNSKYMKANYSSVKNKTPNKNKYPNNKNYFDIIKYTEEELGSLDSEKHIKSAVKILENFQKELIGQLEQEYDENSIKKILQTNFDKIIKLLIKYFTLYDNKCANCINYLKKMLKEIISINLNPNVNKQYNNSDINSEGKVTNNPYKNSYISLIDEEKKKKFLNGEEIIVGLINSLSGGIKNCNKNYRTTVINMAKLIEESNNGLIEIKNKLDNLNTQIKTKTNNEIQLKKNMTLSVNNIITDVENLYTMNYNIIEDVKLIDANQTSFYEEAKEIFNHLKINHSKQLQEYHMFFESISHMQTNANSFKEIKKRGNSFSGNRINNEKIISNNNSSKKPTNKRTYMKLDEKIMGNENYKNINIVNFAEQVLEFFNKMKKLQESIVKKREGTNHMKIDFEKYKKKLIKLVNYIISNKSNENQINLIKQRKDDEITYEKNNLTNLEIIEAENFEIIGEIKLDNKTNEFSEMQIKYNNLLEEINKKSQEINKLQDKVNNIQLENNELKRSSNKNSNNINFDEINKINEEIISPLNNNSLNSNSDKILSNENIAQIKQENKKIKELMNKCVQIIFDSIKETSPNMVEDNFISDESEEKNKNEKNNAENNEQEDEFDMEYITEAVKKFQNYNMEMAKNLKKAEEEKEKYEKQAHENSVKAEAYRNALDQAINNINLGEGGNTSDVNDKNQNKKQFSFEGEGEISFKDNYGGSNNSINPKQEKKEVTNTDVINEHNIDDLNQILVNNSNEEDKHENKNNQENEEAFKINKDLLKIQQNLIEKIKSLEEEIEKNKLTMHNLFIESGNDLYDDINEMSVPMSKYSALLKLLETEQERNKNLEEKYIAFINEITENISLNKKEIENISNKLNYENDEYENNKNRSNKINKNRTYGELNVHNDNYLSILNKDININGDEEENVYENDLRMKKDNNELYSNLKIQEIIEENKDLKEKENLLSTQLITIKQELKETRLLLEEAKKQNIELSQEIHSQGTLKNENLIGSLRNCLERLITEIKINAKIKEILIVLLRLASYTEEQIETIFKYKDKKKNIINIFPM